MIDTIALGLLATVWTLFGAVLIGRATIGEDSPLARWERRRAFDALRRAELERVDPVSSYSRLYGAPSDPVSEGPETDDDRDPYPIEPRPDPLTEWQKMKGWT